MHKEDIEKFSRLEKELEERIATADLSTKGCFGTLVRAYPDGCCQQCDHFSACGNKMEQSRHEMMQSADEETQMIVLKYELESGFKDLMEHRDAKVVTEPEPEPAKVVTEPEPEPAKVVTEPEDQTGPKSMDLVVCVTTRRPEVAEYDKLGTRARTPFDWVGVASKILNEKPSEWKDVRKICIDHMPDPYWHKATGYGNANKLMGKLQADGLIGWDSVAQKILYA